MSLIICFTCAVAREIVRGQDMHRLFRLMEIVLIKGSDFCRRLVLRLGFLLDLVFAAIALIDIIIRQMSDIGDVLDETHLIAGILEDAPQRIGEQEGADIADVDIAVDRRSASIHPDLSFRQ
jgi:hypothetical protein